jgi:hypothetical protein
MRLSGSCGTCKRGRTHPSDRSAHGVRTCGQQVQCTCYRVQRRIVVFSQLNPGALGKCLHERQEVQGVEVGLPPQALIRVEVVELDVRRDRVQCLGDGGACSAALLPTW